jgi:hypothetical protein
MSRHDTGRANDESGWVLEMQYGLADEGWIS